MVKNASKEFKEFLNKTMRRSHENRFSMKEVLLLYTAFVITVLEAMRAITVAAVSF